MNQVMGVSRGASISVLLPPLHCPSSSWHMLFSNFQQSHNKGTFEARESRYLISVFTVATPKAISTSLAPWSTLSWGSLCQGQTMPRDLWACHSRGAFPTYPLLSSHQPPVQTILNIPQSVRRYRWVLCPCILMAPAYTVHQCLPKTLYFCGSDVPGNQIYAVQYTWSTLSSSWPKAGAPLFLFQIRVFIVWPLQCQTGSPFTRFKGSQLSSSVSGRSEIVFLCLSSNKAGSLLGWALLSSYLPSQFTYMGFHLKSGFTIPLPHVLLLVTQEESECTCACIWDSVSFWLGQKKTDFLGLPWEPRCWPIGIKRYRDFLQFWSQEGTFSTNGISG